MSSPVKPISFVLCGHIDHGKSSLSGHLLYKSGCVDERTMDDLRRKAETNKMKGCEYAYLLDVYEEEQARGKTVDYSLVPFEYKDCKYVLVDCPGHQIYVRNLIAGLNITNPTETIGCLIVSLAEGEYEAGMGGGQTREDVLLLRAVGILDLIVVLNKVDLVGVDTPRYAQIQEKLEAYVKGFKFRSVKFHATSGYCGTGVIELLELLQRTARSAPPPPEPTPLITSDTVLIQAQLRYDDDYPLLFSAGLSLIVHCGINEYQVTVEQLWDARKAKSIPYALNQATITARLSSSTKFKVRSGDRVVLRRDDRTIGFGIIKS
jgi:translation elongation factor EF-4